ncbi:transposase [Enhygromyxa salina]|uniref:Transposase n=1 Tax=Enhygromyxa salina TaxID=215803 RepID=A0A0C1ZGS9_9BACT|nr:transposase [Enhygromyxa salina]
MFLAPGRDPAEINNFIGYCLAYTAEKYGVQIHAAVMMSNHYHVDLTDPRADLVEWKRLFNSLTARGFNVRRGRFDKVWSSDGPCDTQRPNDDESLMDLVYTITNPVDAGLVKWSRMWPGFTTADWRFGETRTFKRPEGLFDPNGEMPETASLTLARPPIFLELDDDALYEKLTAAVRAKELSIQDEFRAKGRRFMGLRKLARQDWNRPAVSYEERFTVTPKVAASSKWHRLAQLQRNRDWEREYAEARALWRDGKPAVFPAGTYWLFRFAGVTVAQRPLS